MTICKNYGIIAPEIQVSVNGFKLTVYKEKINDPVNERQNQIISLMRKNKNITREALADIYKVSVETIKKDIRKLREFEIIERVGSDKKGYWKVINKN